MTKKWIVLLLLFFFSATVAADDSDILKIVDGNARMWLGLIDDAKYQESWENASPLFKSKKAEAEWIKTITAIRSPRGAMTARYIATAGTAKSLPELPDGEYVVLQFYTTFAQKGLSMETVTLAKTTDNTWQIADCTLK